MDLEAKSTLIDETIKVAELFTLPELRKISENAKKGKDCSIPCIQNMVQDKNSGIAKRLFFNQPQLSDVRVMVEGKVIYAHKVVVMARCPAMFRSGFTERQNAEVIWFDKVLNYILTDVLFLQVELHDSTYENVLAFLEYLYTDRCPFKDGDAVGILILSSQYLMPRLKPLCEHYLAEAVEKAQVTNVIGKYCRTSLMHH